MQVMHRNFGEAFVDHRGLIQRGVRGINALPDCLRQEPSIKAIEIHHFFYDRFDMNGLAVENFLLLRDPMARLRSTYDFCRINSEQLLHPYAVRMDLREFIHFIAFEWGRGHCDNFVTRSLNNKGNSKIICRKPTPDLLPTTLDRLRSVEILGLVERFDETMVLAEEQLKKHFPGIDLAHAPANVTKKEDRSLCKDCHEAFREALGDDLFGNICKRSALDFELVTEANREMDRRIALIPGFDEKLVDFSARCRKLRSQTQTAPASSTAAP